MVTRNKLRARLNQVRILLLDSSKQVGDLFRNILQSFGFTNILIAHDGYTGVQMLRENPIDLIITDWEFKLCTDMPIHDGRTPNLSGVDFVTRLRRAASSPDPFIPVIMFIHDATRDNLAKARDAGVNEVLMKPLRARELCDRTMAIIENPRVFVTADNYRGPCRRRLDEDYLKEHIERRLHEVRIIRHDEYRGWR